MMKLSVQKLTKEQAAMCRVERFRETGKATADFLMNSGIVEV